jgi:ATP phosphoribosyltransferase
MTLRLGLPSKGRLMEDAFGWFAARGVALGAAGSERAYAARSTGRGWSPCSCRRARSRASWRPGASIWASRAPTSCVRRVAAWETRVEEVAPMGFGAADVVIAVPRLLGGRGYARRPRRRVCRLSTGAWPPAADRDQVSPPHARLPARAWGGGLPPRGQPGRDRGRGARRGAEAIADITSTGETLRANGLRC